MNGQQPNVILINCDDMGYGDLGCYGSQLNQTPYIDALAEEGMKFTSCYASSPVCSPSRAGLLTGCYPPRVGISRVLFPGEPWGLNPAEFTLGNLFHDRGYATMIVGKWHCGDQPSSLPCRFGFDHYYGLPYSNDMGLQMRKNGTCTTNPPLPLLADDEVIQQQPDQEALTERYTERCVDFIRKNAARPFFLYYAQMHVHLPLYAAPRFQRESRNGDFGACMGEVDWSCGVIMEELKRLGLYENTLLIFTSDNGSRADHGASNFPLRGRKASTWEGGQRVPMIVHWPGHVPAGTVNHGIFCNIDFLPSLASIIGGQLSSAVIDGMDQAAAFFDPTACRRTTMAYFDQGLPMGNLNAYRRGRYKLHLRIGGEEKYELYDLIDDIGETQDLSAQCPEIVRELAKEAEALREELGDQKKGIVGKGCRPVGKTENPKPLTRYDENHPYIIAMYDKDDIG